MSGPETGGNHLSFKLYFMLEYVSSEDLECNPQAISWSEDFVIRDREAFLKRIVPRFFKQTKFRSFVSSFVHLALLSCLLFYYERAWAISR